MQFNLESAVRQWRLDLRKQQGLEEGHIAELESNLWDRIEAFVAEGLSEADAFYRAKAKTMDNASDTAEEFYRAHAVAPGSRPPWKERNGFVTLLPNYLKIAVRNLKRKKFYTLMNLAGLALGLVCAGIVGLYIQYETTWDTFHSKHKRVYRLGQHYRSQGYSLVGFKKYHSTERDGQLAQLNGIKDITGVADAAHFYIYNDPARVEAKDQKTEATELLGTNSPAAFFNLFDWQFLKGDAGALSATLNTIALTRSMAEKLFGPGWQAMPDLLGTIIRVYEEDFKLAAVLEDVPPNSHFNFNAVLHESKIQHWGGQTYALLEPGANPAEVKQRLDKSVGSINPRMAESELFAGYIVQPMASIHLQSDLLYEMKPPGDPDYLYVFGIIAAVVLLITCTNYTNLSMAMNTGRSREIGLRKVLGAGRGKVAGQFLLESVLLALLCVPVALFLISNLLPGFNSLMGVRLENLFVWSPLHLLALLALAVLTGLVSGIYPALYLSGRKINQLFRKQNAAHGRSALPVRKALVIFQFSLLIGLGSLTFFINQQLSFIQTKDLGFKKSGVVLVRVQSSENYQQFRQMAEQLPGVAAAGSGTPLGRDPYNQTTYKLGGTETVFDDAYNLYMNFEAVKAYDIETSVPELMESPDQAPEEIMLINRTAAAKLAGLEGIPVDDLVGRQLILEPEYVQEDGTEGLPYQIHGFFEDINMFSLREEVTPCFLQISKTSWSYWAQVSVNTSDVSGLLAELEQIHDELNPDKPFIYKFQEDMLAELYRKERQAAVLTITLSAMALLVAVLGLFGLTAYLTTLKQKEVGVRKVLGATNWQILLQFNREYVPMIGLALLIASPFAWYAVTNWLSGFAYRISINWLVFAGAALFTLAVALAAVSAQAWNTATDNPANSLRSDQ